MIEQTRERASLRARVQALKAVARRISGERRALVEAAHGLRAVVAGSPDWSQLLVSYTIGPIIGGFLAAVAYTAVALTQQERLFGGRLVDTDVPPGRLAGEAEALETPVERPIDKLS